jgi:arsenate reductase (glutaredoxin)
LFNLQKSSEVFDEPKICTGTTNPPSRKELAQMLTFYGGNFKALFNTAGKVYQEMNLKEKMSKMTADEALDLLSKNGRLIKRPFLLLEKNGLVGFDDARWKKILG